MTRPLHRVFLLKIINVVTWIRSERSTVTLLSTLVCTTTLLTSLDDGIMHRSKALSPSNTSWRWSTALISGAGWFSEFPWKQILNHNVNAFLKGGIVRRLFRGFSWFELYLWLWPRRRLRLPRYCSRLYTDICPCLVRWYHWTTREITKKISIARPRVPDHSTHPQQSFVRLHGRRQWPARQFRPDDCDRLISICGARDLSVVASSDDLSRRVQRYPRKFWNKIGALSRFYR